MRSEVIATSKVRERAAQQEHCRRPDGRNEGDEAGDCRCRRQFLTEICWRRRIDRIDIFKVDTQGHEFTILHGETVFFANGTVRFVWVELLLSPLCASRAKADEVIGLLRGSGFKLFDSCDFIYDDMRGPKRGDIFFEVTTVS